MEVKKVVGIRFRWGMGKFAKLRLKKKDVKPSSHGDQIGQFDLCFECSETAKTRHGWTQVLFVETGCIFTICNNEFSKVCD